MPAQRPISRQEAGPNARKYARTRCVRPSSSVASGGPTHASARASRSARRRSQVPEGGTRTMSTHKPRLPTNPAPISPSSFYGPRSAGEGGTQGLRPRDHLRFGGGGRVPSRPDAARLADAHGVSPELVPRDHVDRRPQERGLDDLACFERARERRTFEAGQSRPQAHIARRGVLRLERPDLLDGLGQGQVRAFQQELASEGRAVQRLGRQDPVGHAGIMDERPWSVPGAGHVL